MHDRMPGSASEGDRTEFRRLTYAPALDGLRGIAVLLVISGHFFGWPNPHLGVEIFFVLSGFLITTLLLQERAETGRISLRSFYRRRALRLIPALLIALAGFVVLSTVLVLAAADVPTLRVALAAAAYSALYVANLVQAFDEQLPPGLRHTWSLGIEEQFYVVWPLVLLAALRLRASWRAIAVGLCLTIALITAHRLRLHLDGASTLRTAFAPDTRSDSLLWGCLFGVALHAGLRGPIASAAVRRWASFAGGLTVCSLLFVSPTHHTMILGLWPVFAVAAALVVLRCAVDMVSRTARWLSARWLVYVGRISYGLYLWHVILLWTPPDDVSIPGGVRIAAAFVAAALSYRYVEAPFLRRKRQGGRAAEPLAPRAAPATA
jgi:peptidoglycan/LPS O-acetylase OafA/YrhL